LSFSPLPPPPSPSPFPYTTLFRSALLDTVYVSNFSICNLSCRYCFVYLDEFTELSNVVGYPLVPVFREMIEKGYLAEDAKIEWRSEEHTSELQSLTNIVCRLLLEK